MPEDIIIKNAKIVTPEEIIIGDLLIENGKIAFLGSYNNVKNLKVIDASGNYVLPGGIDAHVHFDLDTPNGTTADDFESGSKAALAGGTTTIIDFITPSRDEKLVDAYAKRIKQAKNTYTDFSFHQSITSWDDSTSQQMEDAVIKQGIRSFKTYLTYLSGIGISLHLLRNVMIKAKELNAIVLVHAEMGQMNDALADQFKKVTKAPYLIHQETHPVESEVQAIEEVIKLAEETACKTYIVHVSTEGGMKAINKAKQRGISVFAETCPQYFYFHHRSFIAQNQNRMASILSPPLRSVANMEYITQSVVKDEIDCISTDHCSFMLKNKLRKNYFKIPHGIGGVQYRMILSLQKLVSSGMLSWIGFARYTAGNPAEIFGLANKGKIKIGYDADLVIIKQNIISHRISSLTDYSKSNINLYNKQKTYSDIKYVIKGGRIVAKDGILKEDLLKGEFIRR